MKTSAYILCGLYAGSFWTLAGCKSDNGNPDLGNGGAGELAVQSVKVQVQVAELMRAAIEMQQSGEPLAEAMGRNLAGFDRNSSHTDQYKDLDSGNVSTDLVGYSTAVESYEYSKYAMNIVAMEAGAGLSLMYGPLLNDKGAVGDAALGLLRDRVQKLAIGSHAGVDAKGPWVMVPAPADNPLNLLGFPGLLPEFAEMRSFDPGIAASGNVIRGCTFTGGYESSAGMMTTVGDYECGYNSLHINRSTADKTLDLDALGFAAWKQGLWVINYFQLVHDINGNAFDHVAEADIAQVGVAGNTVQADDGHGNKGTAGTYIGSTDLEGFQGQLMTEAIDNKAAYLLQRATTSDGQKLGGFSTLQAALNYDYASPLRYFPHSLSISEQPGSGSADPQPSDPTIANAESHLADLSALLGAYAEAFALTDRNNPDVGGSATTRPVFDGFPFLSDNGTPDGESTLHDRALAVLKVALVNLDRLHSDSKSGVLCNIAKSGGCQPAVNTVELVQAIVSLRTAYRALTSQLTLYGNATPDTRKDATALDGTNLSGVPGGVSLAQRIRNILTIQAEALSSKLVDADGLAHNGYALDTNQIDAAPTRLASQAAAVRGLLEAYLATSQSTYRDRAQAAYNVLEQRFYDAKLRIYQTTLGDGNTFVFTPLGLGSLQAALRQMYVLVGATAGNDALRMQIEERVARLNKLILNGWNDRNGDGVVDYPTECLRVVSALPRGGLQLSERALTGELGSERGALSSDRDRDCVPEIDDAAQSALLASELVLVRK